MKPSHRLVSATKKPVDIFWVLSEADLPKRMKFVEDRSRPGHYFLTVTERMRVEDLVYDLQWIANKLNVIKEEGSAL